MVKFSNLRGCFFAGVCVARARVKDGELQIGRNPILKHVHDVGTVPVVGGYHVRDPRTLSINPIDQSSTKAFRRGLPDVLPLGRHRSFAPVLHRSGLRSRKKLNELAAQPIPQLWPCISPLSPKITSPRLSPAVPPRSPAPTRPLDSAHRRPCGSRKRSKGSAAPTASPNTARPPCLLPTSCKLVAHAPQVTRDPRPGSRASRLRRRPQALGARRASSSRSEVYGRRCHRDHAAIERRRKEGGAPGLHRSALSPGDRRDVPAVQCTLVPPVRDE